MSSALPALRPQILQEPLLLQENTAAAPVTCEPDEIFHLIRYNMYTTYLKHVLKTDQELYTQFGVNYFTHL